jgi:glycosyltransferase involved in cell wall biosynthesis
MSETEDRVPNAETRKARELPFVSILMPVRNESAFIATSLGAVLAQDYPHDRLVIVADGMSTDATRDTIVRAAACVPVSRRYR